MKNDDFLRLFMDKKGWVDINVISGFNRMKQLDVTKDLVVKAVANSNYIEIDGENGDKIRMTEDYKEFIDKNKETKGFEFEYLSLWKSAYLHYLQLMQSRNVPKEYMEIDNFQTRSKFYNKYDPQRMMEKALYFISEQTKSEEPTTSNPKYTAKYPHFTNVYG